MLNIKVEILYDNSQYTASIDTDHGNFKKTSGIFLGDELDGKNLRGKLHTVCQTGVSEALRAANTLLDEPTPEHFAIEMSLKYVKALPL